MMHYDSDLCGVTVLLLVVFCFNSLSLLSSLISDVLLEVGGATGGRR